LTFIVGPAQRPADALALDAEPLDEAHRDRRLALAEGGRGDRRDLDVLAVRLVLEAVHDLDEVELRRAAVGDDLVLLEAELLGPGVGGRQVLHRLLGDLEVLELRRIHGPRLVGPLRSHHPSFTA